MNTNTGTEIKALEERAEMLLEAGMLDEAAFVIQAIEELRRTPLELRTYKRAPKREVA
ncbi:MAG: hypothetical protein JST89_19720 [Cyanobacteria bacterium SZAS-4]|nr:hypothetical protein [Cyanobacteria bacterium SZAS-4]